MAATKLHGPDAGLSYREATEPTRGVVAAAEPLPPPQVPPAQAGAVAAFSQVSVVQGMQRLGVRCPQFVCRLRHRQQRPCCGLVTHANAAHVLLPPAWLLPRDLVSNLLQVTPHSAMADEGHLVGKTASAAAAGAVQVRCMAGAGKSSRHWGVHHVGLPLAARWPAAEQSGLFLTPWTCLLCRIPASSRLARCCA